MNVNYIEDTLNEAVKDTKIHKKLLIEEFSLLKSCLKIWVLLEYLGTFPIMWKLWKYFWIIINENKFALLVSVSTCKELDHHHTIHQQVKSSANLKMNNSSRMCKRGKDTGQTTISKVQKT